MFWGPRTVLALLSASALACCVSVIFSTRVSAEEKPEPQSINVSAPTASSELDRLIAEKAQRDKVRPVTPAPEFESRWSALESSGVLNGPDLSAKMTSKRHSAGELLETRGEPDLAADTLAPRIAADISDSEPQINAIQNAAAPRAQKAPMASDPEFKRFVDSAENDAPQLAVPTKTVPPTAAQRAADINPAPRLTNNHALDENELKAPTRPAESLLAALPAPAAAEKKTLVAPAVKEAPKSAPLDADYWKPQGVAIDKAQAKSRIPDLPPSLRGARDGNSVEKGSEDPEAHMQKLLSEIAVLGARLKVMNQAERDRIGKSLDTGAPITTRSESALKAISAMRSAQAPGAVSIKVFDVKSKQPLVSRVQIIDASGTTARAPLKDGFWFRGASPAINVLPGLVRVEVSQGGRFQPHFIKGLSVKSGILSPLEIPITRVPQLDFEARGWVLADLDIGLRARPGESRVWFGAPANINDLILGAKAEGVRVLGVALPLGDAKALASIQDAIARDDSGVLLLPVFPGPRHVFNGTGMGLGVERWDELKTEIADPEIPLRDGFDMIRASGGLAVLKDFAGLKQVSIQSEILPVFARLRDNGYFDSRASKMRLYSAAELPFDTITNAYDLMSFDGTDASEAVWFNLLNEGAKVQIIGAGGGSLEGGRIPFGQTFIQTDGGKVSRGNVLAAIQSGRTSVSFGPAAFCKIFERDMGPGSVLPTDGRALSLQIQAYSSLTPGAHLDKIEIIRNGKIVYEQKAAEGESEINDFKFPIRESGNAWYVLRVTERIKRGKRESEIIRRAWTSPIYFRGAAFAEPKPAIARVHGVIRKGLTPVRGVVTALSLGQPPVRVQTGADGSYAISLPASGSLVFKADECQPIAMRVFEHERIQRAMGRQLSQDEPLRKLSERSIFGMWRLLLSDLEWDITLCAEKESVEAPTLPEPD